MEFMIIFYFYCFFEEIFFSLFTVSFLTCEELIVK